MVRLSLGLVLLLSASVTLSAKEVQPEPMPTPAPVVEAWAMLFQMMDRLHSAVARREFTLIHNEDPVASAAVSTLIAEVNKSWAPSSPEKKVAWIALARTISALHTAGDAGQNEAFGGAGQEGGR